MSAINDQKPTESSTCLEMCKGRSQPAKEMNMGIRIVNRRRHLFSVVADIVINLIEHLTLQLPPQFSKFKELIKTA